MAHPTRAPTSTQSTQELPEYVPLSAPLNTHAQQALNRLLYDYPLAEIADKLVAANKMLTSCAGDITERLTEIRGTHQHKKAKRAERLANGEDLGPEIKEANERYNVLKDRVEGMTKRMEKELRKGIDGYAHCDALEAAVKDLQRTAVSSASTQFTQATQEPSSAITLPGSTNPGLPAFTPSLQAALECHADDYGVKSLAARYARHNDYIGFKNLVHESSFPVDQVNRPSVPHARTWFEKEEGAAPPQPGVTNADDSDDDIAIDRENISTRCPITLAEFIDPVKSKKCPHSFEKSAILEMIGQARPPTSRGARQAFVPSVTCPVPGCPSELRKEDLEQDAMLTRRIKRLQRMKARAEEEGESQLERGSRNGRRQAESIDSGEDDVDDVEERPRGSVQVKIKRHRDEIED
jgi:hypothetical protein